MAGTTGYTYPIDNHTALDVYYDTAFRCWWAYYTCRITGNQIGDGWHADSKENALIFRPALTELTYESLGHWHRERIANAEAAR